MTISDAFGWLGCGHQPFHQALPLHHIAWSAAYLHEEVTPHVTVAQTPKLWCQDVLTGLPKVTANNHSTCKMKQHVCVCVFVYQAAVGARKSRKEQKYMRLRCSFSLPATGRSFVEPERTSNLTDVSVEQYNVQSWIANYNNIFFLWIAHTISLKSFFANHTLLVILVLKNNNTVAHTHT